jgi:hypothetical protein
MGLWFVSIILAAHIALVSYNNAILGETAKAHAASDRLKLIPGASASGVPRKAIEDMRDGRKKTAIFLSETFAGKYFLAEKISRLSPNLPGSMWIENLSFSVEMRKGKTETELLFAGNIYTPKEKDIEQINDFVDFLRNDPVFMTGFKTIKLSSVKKDKAIGDKIIWRFELLLEAGNAPKK